MPTAPAAPRDQAASAAGGRRLWISLLFCVAPLVVLTAVLVFRIPVSTVLLWAIILLCPLSHLLLGRGGGGHAHAPRSRAMLAAGRDGSGSPGQRGSCH